jgi:hypothetical protein
MICSQESDDRESNSLRHCYSAQFRLERGIWICVQLLLPAIDRVWNSRDNPDSERMLQHPKSSSQFHSANNGDYQESSEERRIRYGSIWRVRSGTPSRISRTYPFAIPNGSSTLQQHHWKADVLNYGLYTIGIRLYRKCIDARLRKVFSGSHDGKLDHWNIGI